MGGGTAHPDPNLAAGIAAKHGAVLHQRNLLPHAGSGYRGAYTSKSSGVKGQLKLLDMER